MFYEIVIHPDGTVSPCCLDYDYKKQSLGNIKETSLKEIWNSLELWKIRLSELELKKSPYEICNKCTGKITNSTINITPYRKEILKQVHNFGY